LNNAETNVLNETTLLDVPTRSYGASIAVWDHVMLCYLPPNTSELTVANRGQRGGRLSWLRWLGTCRNGL